MHLSSLGSLVAFSALVSGAVARTTGRINYAKLAQRNNSIAASVDSQHPIKPKCGGLPEPEPETPLSCDQFWLENIDHQGKAPYATFPNYQVWRNVKDFGAVGDGIQDDTKAINDAISFGDRCGPGTCNGSTTTPALIYFPSGTYLVSEPIIDYYYTQLIGNPIPACRPVFKAAETFVAPWVLDSNPYGYQPNGAQAWGATNVFWRQVANFVFDLTSVPPESEIRAIHWPSSQATSLSNIEINLSAAANTNHRGLFIENGSGGYVGDITVNGGYWGLEIGNQQFTFRNITVNNAKVAIKQLWSWGWTYMGIAINNCGVGFDFTAGNATTGELTVGTITILDSDIRNTPIGIQYGLPVPSFPPQANTFIFENIRLENVPAAILGPDGQVVLSGTPTRTLIEAWGRGNAYSSSGGPEPFQGLFPPVQRPGSLTVSSSNGDYYTASKPYYQNHPVSSFYTARQFHAKGDGEIDDTEALNELFSKAAKHHKIVYINAGIYKVTRTIQIPPGSRIFGDSSFPQIVSSGSYFQDESKPKPVIQVGSRGSKGRIEWSNTIVSTRGRQPGAILIEYNLKTPIDAGKSSHGVKPSGMWDVHVRVGGFAGSDLQLTQCAKTPQKTITPDNLDRDCVAAFMSWHLTPESGGLYQENNWVWVADHDIEEPANNEQITIYAGRGLLLESRDGPNWLVASSVEHHQRYEYQLWKTRNVFAGQIQTETAYYQPNPDVNLPFAADEKYHDPIFGQGESGWGLRVVNSKDVAIYGAGLYSFFDNYNVTCSQIGEGSRCQKRTFSVEGDTERLRVYNLNTVGTTNMITVNGVDTGLYSDNQDGFVQSIAIFSDIDIIS